MPEGIWTGGMKQEDAKKSIAEKIAALASQATTGETKRKGRAKWLGNIGGWLAGEGAYKLFELGLAALTGGTSLAATTAFNAARAAGKVSKIAKIASALQKGGKAAKLAKAVVKGGSMWATKGIVDKATKGEFLGIERLKTPGQVDEIKVDSKYGYGEKEAKTLTEELTRSRESTEQDAGTLLASIGSSLAFDMMSDKAGGLLGDGKEVVETGEPWQESLFGGVDPNAGKVSKGLGLPFYDASADEFGWNPLKEDVPFDLEGYLSAERDYAQGGQVPSEEEAFMELLSLVQPQQQEEEIQQQQPSIADYFGSQGKTLGGNNTQSLSQMLGG